MLVVDDGASDVLCVTVVVALKDLHEFQKAVSSSSEMTSLLLSSRKLKDALGSAFTSQLGVVKLGQISFRHRLNPMPATVPEGTSDL
mmetsp:Transcript_78676/g.218484  ORF Transcript_78676/g.218484 Transcript_78676/m.218484 type:complete len:87 (-) Transcript_78676:1289-1549(-)